MLRRRLLGGRQVEYLFRDHDLHAVCENQRERMVQGIKTAEAADIGIDGRRLPMSRQTSLSYTV
jgi:hypothetical protein